MLLAEIAFGKFCLHLPLHRQSRAFAREGVEIDVSTMADWMGAVSVALKPMVEIIEAHVLAAQRLHVDDTPVPVLAKGRTKTGRLWTAVRDDRPYGGADPPAAFYVYSSDRAGVHPEAFPRSWAGIMQADAYAGFGKLYEPGRLPGTIVEAGCWAHWRRKFYEIAALKKAPIAVEAVTRIDAIFAIERTINGSTQAEWQAVRYQTIRPLVGEFVAWLNGQRRTLSPKSETAKAMDYGLKRMPAFTRFLDDGRICLSNNAAERGEGPVLAADCDAAHGCRGTGRSRSQSLEPPEQSPFSHHPGRARRRHRTLSNLGRLLTVPASVGALRGADAGAMLAASRPRRCKLLGLSTIAMLDLEIRYKCAAKYRDNRWTS